VLFGVSAEIAKACEPLARDLPFARAEAKHLYAACTALDAASTAILVVSNTIRSWDRDVIEARALHMRAPVLWVSPSDDPDDVATSIAMTIKTSIKSWRAAAPPPPSRQPPRPTRPTRPSYGGGAYY
jgi:hypothetical protein